MNPAQGEVVQMPNTSQPNNETQELIWINRQTKKKLPILRFKDMNDESIKPVLNKLTGYEPNHESFPFSTNNAMDATTSLISDTAAIQDPKYHVNPNKPVILLLKFIKEHNVDYDKDLYLEGIKFT